MMIEILHVWGGSMYVAMGGSMIVAFHRNCLLSFDQVYIERKYYPNPTIEKRRIRSIFSPKSSRILRVLLNNSQRRPWGVWELAKEADVSIGLASKVKERLLDLEYITGDKYLTLMRPIELLEEWSNNYSFRKNKTYDYFSFDELLIRA